MMHKRIFRFRVDLHVHTRRFSPCAETFDPLLLRPVLEKSRLDGLVITEHDHLWPADEIARLNEGLRSKRIYRGVEVSSANGHFIVIGLDGLDGIGPGVEVAALLSEARRQQAAVIWAHPRLQYASLSAPLAGAAMPAGLDAIEVASSATCGKASKAARALARRMSCATVGGSDAHFPGQVGCAYTRLADLPENEKQLAAMIRKGVCHGRHRTRER
jgi:hypothetical protein